MKSVYEAGEKNKVRYEEKGGGMKGPKMRRPEEYSEVMRMEKKNKNGGVSAFVVQPDGVKFETQESKEKVLLLLRKHWSTNIKTAVVVLLLVVAPVLLGGLPAFWQIPYKFQVLTLIVWYLAVFGVGFEAFLVWYFNVYIITDERVIDYDFYSLLYKRVSEAKIDRIEDVTYSMGGVAMNVFNYGTVEIQTAGEKRELEFIDVPKPDTVVRLLNELVIEEEQEKLEGRVR